MTDTEVLRWLSTDEAYQWCDCGDGSCPCLNEVLRTLAETRKALLSVMWHPCDVPLEHMHMCGFCGVTVYKETPEHNAGCFSLTVPRPL